MKNKFEVVLISMQILKIGGKNWKKFKDIIRESFGKNVLIITGGTALA